MKQTSRLQSSGPTARPPSRSTTPRNPDVRPGKRIMTSFRTDDGTRSGSFMCHSTSSAPVDMRTEETGAPAKANGPGVAAFLEAKGEP